MTQELEYDDDDDDAYSTFNEYISERMKLPYFSK